MQLHWAEESWLRDGTQSGSRLRIQVPTRLFPPLSFSYRSVGQGEGDEERACLFLGSLVSVLCLFAQPFTVKVLLQTLSSME